MIGCVVQITKKYLGSWSNIKENMLYDNDMQIFIAIMMEDL